MIRAEAIDIYKILIICLGAYPDDQDRFVDAMADQACQEYRFGGVLGFGGKFHNNCGWWVSCYKEHETADNQWRMNDAQRELILLKNRHNPLGVLARGLTEHYEERYPLRCVTMEDDGGSVSSGGHRFMVVFSHSTPPYRPYLRLMFRESILVCTKRKPSGNSKNNATIGSVWQAIGEVAYEDPQMFDKLDALVDRVVGTTPRLEG